MYCYHHSDVMASLLLCCLRVLLVITEMKIMLDFSKFLGNLKFRSVTNYIFRKNFET